MSIIKPVELDFHSTRRAMSMLFAAGVSTIIKSPPGQGKSSMIHQYAEAQGPDYGLFELNCALANIPDYMGWFYKVDEQYTGFDGKATTIGAGHYSFPYFGFDKRNGRPWFQFERGCLLFEEYGQCEPDLKRALGGAFLDHRVGQWVIPPKFDVVALSNRDTDRSGVTRDFDFQINRRGELNYRANLDNWLIYAHENNMQPMTMAFASIASHGVFTAEMPKEQGPWLTPRSLDMLDRLMKVAIDQNVELDDPLLRTTASGVVGTGTAGQYITFAALRSKIPSVAAIVKDPAGTMVPAGTDQQMFLVFNLADKADRKNIDSIATYLQRLPSDMSIAFYRAALTRDSSLIGVPAFGRWAVANKQLLSLVNARV